MRRIQHLGELMQGSYTITFDHPKVQQWWVEQKKPVRNFIVFDTEGDPMQEVAAIWCHYTPRDDKPTGYVTITSRFHDFIKHESSGCDVFATQFIHGLNPRVIGKCGAEENVIIHRFNCWVHEMTREYGDAELIVGNGLSEMERTWLKSIKLLEKVTMDSISLPEWSQRIDSHWNIFTSCMRDSEVYRLGYKEHMRRGCHWMNHSQYEGKEAYRRALLHLRRGKALTETQAAKVQYGYHCALSDVVEILLHYCFELHYRLYVHTLYLNYDSCEAAWAWTKVDPITVMHESTTVDNGQLHKSYIVHYCNLSDYAEHRTLCKNNACCEITQESTTL